MAVNATRQSEHDAAVALRDSVHGARGHVILSPSGMAHVALDGAGLQSICVHSGAVRSEGWVEAGYTWDAVPPGVVCCKTCTARF